jgi:hypothetical protein
MVGADVAQGSTVPNHDDKRIDSRLSYIEGLGMRDQQVRGSLPEDLKDVEQAHYCGVDCDPGRDIGGGHNWRLTEKPKPVSVTTM